MDDRDQSGPDATGISASGERKATLLAAGAMVYSMAREFAFANTQGGHLMKNMFLVGVLGSALLIGATSGHAASWVKNEVDVPNKNVEANYYNADSVKVHAKTLSWTEKFILTNVGTAAYTKHLSQYPACKSNISTKGDVTQHQLDFEIKGGKFRLVAKRNYNKANKLVCTDKDMGTELDRSWHEVLYKTPMYERNYILSTKYKIGDLQ